MYTYIAYNVNIRKYIHKTIFAQKRKCVLHYKNVYKEHKHGVSETSWYIFPYILFMRVDKHRDTQTISRNENNQNLPPLADFF